jgi:hypothetical protein
VFHRPHKDLSFQESFQMIKLLISNSLIDLAEVAHVDTVRVKCLGEGLTVSGYSLDSLEVTHQFGDRLVHKELGKFFN